MVRASRSAHQHNTHLFFFCPEEAPEPAPQKVEAQAASPTATRGNAKTRGGPASRGGKYYARGGKPGPKDGAPAEEPAADNQRKCWHPSHLSYLPFFDPFRQPKAIAEIVETVVAEVVVAVVVIADLAAAAAEVVLSTSTVRPVKRVFSCIFISTSILIHLPSDSDKKIHQGWGGDDGNAEFKAEEAATVDAVAEGAVATEWGGDASGGLADWGAPAESSADAWAAPAEGAPAGDGEAKTERPGRREREPEEEDNTLTLDQYLAQQKEKDSVIPKLESTRKANDGDDSWEGVVPLAKNEEEDAYFVGKVRFVHDDVGTTSHLLASPSPRAPPKLVPRRKKRSSSRSRLVLIAPTVVVADVAVVEIVEVIVAVIVHLTEDVVLAVVAVDVVAWVDAVMQLSSTLMTKPPSLRWPNRHYHQTRVSIYGYEKEKLLLTGFSQVESFVNFCNLDKPPIPHFRCI